MKKNQVLALLLTGLLTVSCGQKKKNDDIIVKKVETPKPQGPISMQDYTQTKDIIWLGKNYQVEIRRVPDQTLPMVKDEDGQEFVDNHIVLRVIRSDGSEFVNHTFTKAAFEAKLDQDYRSTGILEGLVFDKVDGGQLIFAASVSHPQTDEYVPFVVTLSRMGDLGISLDTQMDTHGDEEQQKPEEEGV